MGIIAMGYMNRLGYLIREGLRSVFTHGFMSFASITIILACLLIMGSFTLLALNIDYLIKDLESDNEMLAFIDDSLEVEDAQAIEPYIAAIPNVRDVVFIRREQAYEDFLATNAEVEDAVYEDIESDVFRHRYVVYLDDIAYMAETQAEVKTVEGVADVAAQLDISEGFVTVQNIVSAVSAVIIVILLIVSIFIMSNTVKLTTFSRREEIAIMRMVGATNSFIRTPFIIEGLFIGLIGATFAFFAQWGVYTLVSDSVMNHITGGLVNVIPFESLMLTVGLMFAGVGTVVGLFGGSLAIRNYLRV